MEIGDKVRYIGGQEKEGRKQFKLEEEVFYQIRIMQPEYLKDLGLCMCVGLKGITNHMFRADLFVVIPVMKEQIQRKHANYCTDKERAIVDPTSDSLIINRG